MNKLSLSAVVWTLALALPFTLAALIGIAYLTEHAVDITRFFQTIQQHGIAGEQEWFSKIATRLPELAGMLIGQMVILTILIFSRKIKSSEEI